MHQAAQALVADVQHHHVAAGTGSGAHPAREIGQRQRAAAVLGDQAAVQLAILAVGQFEHLLHVAQRQRQQAVGHAHHQHAQHGKGQRHGQFQLAAVTQPRLHAQGAAQLGHAGLDHVHADAAAGDVRHRRGGAEAGTEDQFVALGLAQAGGLGAVQQALLDRLAAQDVRVHAVAVVADRDHDALAALAGGEHDAALSRLAVALAFVRHFHAMVEGVAQQVNQRIGQRLDQAAVEVGALAFQHQFDLLAELAREVAHDPREALEQASDRLHAHAHRRALQRIGDAIEFARGGGQRFVAEARGQAEQAIAQQHQLAGVVDQQVESRGVHAHRVIRRRGRTRRGSVRRRRGRCGCR